MTKISVAPNIVAMRELISAYSHFEFTLLIYRLLLT